MCSGLVWMFPGLSGLPAELLSTSKPWSARHSSSSSRRENSSPGRRCRLQTEHLKHSMWYTFSRALITRSLLQKPMLHFAHLMPNNLEKVGAERRVGLMQKSSWIKKKIKKSDVQIKKSWCHDDRKIQTKLKCATQIWFSSWCTLVRTFIYTHLPFKWAVSSREYHFI